MKKIGLILILADDVHCLAKQEKGLSRHYPSKLWRHASDPL